MHLPLQDTVSHEYMRLENRKHVNQTKKKEYDYLTDPTDILCGLTGANRFDCTKQKTRLHENGNEMEYLFHLHFCAVRFSCTQF